MSAFLSSIKNMVDNYGQGIISIQGKLCRELLLSPAFCSNNIIAVGSFANINRRWILCGLVFIAKCLDFPFGIRYKWNFQDFFLKKIILIGLMHFSLHKCVAIYPDYIVHTFELFHLQR